MAKGAWWLPDKLGGTAVGEVGKWVWALWGSALTTILQNAQGWIAGHPNWTATILGLATAIVLFSIAFLKRSEHGSVLSVGQPDIPPAGVNWEHAAVAQDAVVGRLEKQIKNLQAQIETNAPLLAELERYKIAGREAQQSTQRDADLETNAPALEITYRAEDRAEILFLKNDGPQTARNISIGPLRWSEMRHIQLSHPPSPIESKHTEPCPITFHADGNTSLFDFVRSNTPSDAEATVRVGYSDSRSLYNFRRDFTLKTFNDGHFLWQPGPVKLRDAGDAD